jgi:phosphoribosyl 1,2-cyclic phosphodiesterase
MAFEVRFWGVRGSVASPGPDTAAVGGNTSSLEVRAGDTRVLLDAGTGIRQLGDALLGEGGVDVTILLSHLHWDHIQGLPFFTPVYLPTTRVRIWGPPGERTSLHDVLAQQMAPPVFPVTFDDLASRIETRELHAGERFRLGALDVSVARLNHPGGVLAYRLESGGHALVYATDNEHHSAVGPTICELAQGADVLVYDAQYTPAEYRGDGCPARVGWGHSTYESAVTVARAAAVKQLVLFHHDPKRSDAAVEAIETRARAVFPDTLAAREGMVLDVGRRVALVA